MTHVFVYGTLRCGGSNHTLIAHARCLGVAWTEPAFTLHDLGPYPAMVAVGTTSVEGEVYAVDASTLARLDRLEGYPGDYDRIEVRLQDGRVALAYTMTPAQVAGCPVIPDGRWPHRHVPGR